MGEDEPPDDLLDDWWDVKGREVHRMDDKALKAFVLGFLDNTIYTSTHLRNPDDIGMVFLPAMFGAFSSWPKSRLDQIGCLWEYWDRALPRSVNGQPIFSNVRVMHRDDWGRALKAITKEREHRENIEI